MVELGQNLLNQCHFASKVALELQNSRRLTHESRFVVFDTSAFAHNGQIPQMTSKWISHGTSANKVFTYHNQSILRIAKFPTANQ